jgi:hypothetical protein
MQQVTEKRARENLHGPTCQRTNRHKVTSGVYKQRGRAETQQSMEPQNKIIKEPQHAHKRTILLLRLISFLCSFSFYLVCEAIGTAATPGLLCQPRVIVKMFVETQMECRLAGATKFSVH